MRVKLVTGTALLRSVAVVRWWERRSGGTTPLPKAAAAGNGCVAPPVSGEQDMVLPQRSCGMPFFESGNIDSTRASRLRNAQDLLPFVPDTERSEGEKRWHSREPRHTRT